jgi:hypothetical protein
MSDARRVLNDGGANGPPVERCPSCGHRPKHQRATTHCQVCTHLGSDLELSSISVYTSSLRGRSPCLLGSTCTCTCGTLCPAAGPSCAGGAGGGVGRSVDARGC